MGAVRVQKTKINSIIFNSLVFQDYDYLVERSVLGSAFVTFMSG